MSVKQRTTHKHSSMVLHHAALQRNLITWFRPFPSQNSQGNILSRGEIWLGRVVTRKDRKIRDRVCFVTSKTYSLYSPFDFPAMARRCKLRNSVSIHGHPRSSAFTFGTQSLGWPEICETSKICQNLSSLRLNTCDIYILWLRQTMSSLTLPWSSWYWNKIHRKWCCSGWWLSRVSRGVTAGFLE